MRKFIISIIIIFFVNDFFSYDKSFFSEWTINEIDNTNPRFLQTKENGLFGFDINQYICLSDFCLIYLTDNKSYLNELDVGCSSNISRGQKASSQIENFRLGDFYTYLFDLNYDGKVDLLNYAVSGMAVSLILMSLDTNKYLFESDLYKSFKNVDIQFCIINGKRGFKFKQPDDNNIPYWTFFYWDVSEQRYVLDHNVSKTQLQNAIFTENYFAYNGLKFSKLESKLTESDLIDLDKAQLRLMRNAVYARYGRTFKSVDLQSLWECYTWYKKNPYYNDSMLTDIDKYNIELIQKYEAK